MTGGEVAGDGTDGVGVGPNWPRCKTGAQIYDAKAKRKNHGYELTWQAIDEYRGQ